MISQVSKVQSSKDRLHVSSGKWAFFFSAAQTSHRWQEVFYFFAYQQVEELYKSWFVTDKRTFFSTSATYSLQTERIERGKAT